MKSLRVTEKRMSCVHICFKICFAYFSSSHLEACFQGLLARCFDLVEKIISGGSEVPSKFLFSEYLELILMMVPSVPDGHKELLKIVLKTIGSK